MRKYRLRDESSERVEFDPEIVALVEELGQKMEAYANWYTYRVHESSTSSSSSAARESAETEKLSVARWLASLPEDREKPLIAPPKKSSEPENNPGYWADYVKSEENIRRMWLDKYGHHFYGKLQAPSSTSGGERYKKDVHWHQTALKGNECLSAPVGPIPQVRSDIKGVKKHNAPRGPTGWYIDYDRPKGNVLGWRQDEVRAPKMAYDYPASGNAQKHHAAKDHVTSHSSTFGHHSVQFGNQNQISVLNAKTPTSSYDFYLQVRSSARSNSASNTKHPACLDTPKSSSSSSGLYSDVPYKQDGRDELSQKLEGFSLAGLQRVEPLRGLPRREMPPPGVCPKCLNCIGCTCVPRRREHVSEDPEDGPSEELPPWPPQIWCGPSYAGSRHGTTGDIQRLRYRLSRDPEWRTPMNRMYDEVKALNYSGGKSQHYGDDSFSCGLCRTTREAERGTWFDEQLRKGNPFTTGDTQFKSSAYIPRK